MFIYVDIYRDIYQGLTYYVQNLFFNIYASVNYVLNV